MSPSALDVDARSRSRGQSAGGAAARRRAARRRRRLRLLGVFGVLAVVIAVIQALPLVQKAVNDLSLPLNYTDTIRQQAAEKHLDRP